MYKYNVNTPEGTRDRVFSECRFRRQTEKAITGVFENRGYSEIITPEVEFYDLFVQSGNPLPQESMVKVIDRSGKILVMRPDNTTPVARVAATLLRGSGGVKRLYYNQTVFRSDNAHSGSESEIPQCGIELIGTNGMEADLEVILTGIEALEAAGAEDYRIELGHVEFYKALASALALSDDLSEDVRNCIENKKFAELRSLLKAYEDEPAAQDLLQLSHLFGDLSILDRAKDFAHVPAAQDALAYLKELYEKIAACGYGSRVRFDLGLVHQLDYYTGVVFRGYVRGASDNILSGGRYDNLLSFFGSPAPATGFAINTGSLDQSLQQQKKVKSDRLKIAVTKGRLLEESVDLFEKMGLDCLGVRNPGRRLVAEIPNYGLDVLMSKAPDVITYVENGVCDIGIVGKDTILESSGSFYEVLDLGYGKCRFALAVREGDDFYGSYGPRHVASKYPGVAKRFFAEKGMDVSVIKIEGSVELAPILGLADAIVDIVQTGSTLKANGLVPIETISEVSARLIVNKASMKLYRDEIMDFIERCEDVLYD